MHTDNLTGLAAPTLRAITQHLDHLLANDGYKDASCNGLQVESGIEQVRTVAVAVDSGLSVLEAAIAENAELLIVHHGLYWSPGNHVTTGLLGQKVRTLIHGGCSLYASHLPLDGHPYYGNAAQLAFHLELNDCEPFFSYQGSIIGTRARSEAAVTMADIIDRTKNLPGVLDSPIALDFGSPKIHSIGIVTGSGASAIEAASAAGIDLLISGEGKQEAFHSAKDLGMNALFLGHYATETLGVRALGALIEQSFAIKSVFIHLPTGF